MAELHILKLSFVLVVEPPKMAKLNIFHHKFIEKLNEF